MSRLLRLLLAALFLATPAVAQTGLLRGHLLINDSTGAIITDVQVTMPGLGRLTTPDGDGTFVFSQVPYGEHIIAFGGSTIRPDTIKVVVTAPVVDLRDITVIGSDRGTSLQSIQIPTLALEESDASSDDDGLRTQNISGLLTASRDPFLSTAAFVFGPYRFQPRGYDRAAQQVLINGAPMNDVETGDAFWSQWGGLNDVFRSRAFTYGLNPSEYAFGGPLGTTYFDATAAAQRKQTRITYSATNRQYRNRLMLTHSSGLLASGWAYSASVSKRWSDEGYVPGTFYDGYSYYFGLSRKIRSNTISLTTFGAPTRRGKIAPTIQEAYDLAGTNFYNPNWGYQNGEKRNARVANTHTPTFLLNWERTPAARTRWNTTLGVQVGRVSNSTLDWFNAADPRPDYYRNLPSYSEFEGNLNEAQIKRDRLSSDPDRYLQIQWDRLYEANYMNALAMPDATGALTGQVARRSVYAVGADVDEVRKLIFNTNMERVWSEHVTVYGGVSAIAQRTHTYREMLDLMGGDYWVNISQFAQRNFPVQPALWQADLNNPFGIIKEGDHYSYDYINRFAKGWAWGQVTATYNKFDFFAAAHGGYNTFNREGLFRNGLFAGEGESFGKGEDLEFWLYGVKGGATYKYNGRHYFFVNGGFFADAPTVDNTYISPRTRNEVVTNPTTQKTATIEGGYLHRSPKLNLRAVGYSTRTSDGQEIKRFYNENTEALAGVAQASGGETFTNYVLQDIRAQYVGTELAVDYKINPSVSVTGVAALGQAFYANRPRVSVYTDNDTSREVVNRVTYIQNYYLAVGPQSAYSLGVNYRSKRYYYLTLTGNFFNRNYIDIAADRRTAEAVELMTPGSPEWNEILEQEKMASAFTLDFFGGKSILLSKLSKAIPRNTFIYINLGVSNLLDKKDIRTGGFEQLRFDFENNRPGSFPPKYFYAYGRNYFVNVSLKF